METTNPFGAWTAQMASEASVETWTGIQRYLPLGLRTNIVLHDFIVGHARATRYKFATVVAMVGTMHSLMKGMFSRNIGRWKKDERNKEKER